MCGRFVMDADGEALKSHFGLSEAPKATPRFHICPTQPVLTVVGASGEGSQPPLAQWSEWGFTSPFKPDSSQRLFNARSETAHQKLTFRQAFSQGRCLIPATGYFEWKTSGSQKHPWFFYLPGPNPAEAEPQKEPQRTLLAFAGLWQSTPQHGTVCTILTTAANPSVQAIHHRMPVYLPPQAYAQWLAPHAPTQDLLHLLASHSPHWASYPLQHGQLHQMPETAHMLAPAPHDPTGAASSPQLDFLT